ncbi:HAD-IA family hydrolase [Halomarina oriensis]|uniref:HAD-IA family hydrolase n=1 Tax=Halomarina oriensis TaxID=671145 RepID=A0A6B0GIL5_9EURY|nr:HAD-IA family hydrolase [Halomarina oriensis]
MTYDAIVFDNDGVLTEITDWEVLRGAARDAFSHFDVDPSDEDLSRVLSSVTPEGLEAMCARHGLDTADFWYRRDTNYSTVQRREVREGRKPMYDDAEVVRDLDVPLGIVSSNQHATIEYILDHYDLREQFETYYGRRPTIEDVRRKKPNPHFVERALADIGTENALFVGDSETDVEAAHAAGVDSVFLRREHRADDDLSVDPTYEFETLDPLTDLV